MNYVFHKLYVCVSEYICMTMTPLQRFHCKSF